MEDKLDEIETEFAHLIDNRVDSLVETRADEMWVETPLLFFAVNFLS